MMSFKSILQTISGTCLSLARGVSSLAGDWTASSRVISLVLKRKTRLELKSSNPRDTKNRMLFEEFAIKI
jgi:hypothetical protein